MMAENIGLRRNGAQHTCPCVNWSYVQSTPQVSRFRVKRKFLTSPYRKLIARWVRRSPEGDNLEHEAFLGKQWRIYSLSPLFHLKRHHAALVNYARCLKVSLREAQVSRTDGPNSQLIYCHFSFDESLSFSPDDPPTLRIEVRERRTDGHGSTIVMEAFLICVELSVSPRDSPVGASFDYYPVVLVTGDRPMSTVLFNWLESHFNAESNPLTLSDIDMRFMLALSSASLPDTSSPPVYTQFTLDDRMKEYYDAGIETYHCKQLWERLFPHPDVMKVMSEHEAELFVGQLITMLEERTKLQLRSLHLSEVGTPAAYVSKKGKMKIFSEWAIFSILHHLCEIALVRYIFKGHHVDTDFNELYQII